MTKIIKLKCHIPEIHAEKLMGKYLEDDSYDEVITEDTDAYDLHGKLLFKFRKKVVPIETLRLGYESFKGSLEFTEGRGMAAGGNSLRVRKDGSVSKISVAKKVWSGNVGSMDAGGLIAYCRKTAFARNHFDKFTQGIPFVKCIDNLYKQLCPEHYKKQINIARATNMNYVIADTSFTTVTVNKNFQTAVHKDSGDLPEGFGNLCVYREGKYDGSYFCLPQYRAAVDMQNGDILFADVHRFHGNTPFRNCSEDYLRIAFVMYYREFMKLCKSPSEELAAIKQEKTGYLKL